MNALLEILKINFYLIIKIKAWLWFRGFAGIPS